LFPIGQSRTEPEMLPLMDDKILVLKDEVQVGNQLIVTLKLKCKKNAIRGYLVY